MGMRLNILINNDSPNINPLQLCTYYSWNGEVELDFQVIGFTDPFLAPIPNTLFTGK